MNKAFKTWFKNQRYIPQGDSSYAEIAWDAAWEAAVLAEREACAKVCESKLPYQEEYDFQRAAGNTARACAAAIRARGNNAS